MTYLFGKQVQQSSEQFVCGSLGVLALLGIGESCTVNVAVLVAWQPFFQFLTGLCHKRLEPLATLPQQFYVSRKPQMALVAGGVGQAQVFVI